MKQKLSGSKLINWHRPLAASELSRRYRRFRDEESRRNIENTNAKNDDLGDDDNAAFDWYWDYEYPVEEIDYLVLAAWNFILQGGIWQHIGSLLARAEWVAELQKNHVVSAPTTLATWQTKAKGFEKSLAAHLQQIANPAPTEDRLPSTIRAAIHHPEDLELLYRIATEADQEGLALNLLMFAPFWIRPPATWIAQDLDSPNWMVSLVDHLFVRYPVPKFLYAEWMERPDCVRMKWLCWSILLGQGGSLYNAAAFFGWQITRKFQHYLHNVPHHVTAIEACMYAEVVRLGGSELEFERLRANPAFVMDPTAISSQPSYLPFWTNTVSWLSQNRNSITNAEAALILDWAMHQYTESERAGMRSFSWRGRSLQRVLAASIEYRRQIERPFAAYSWRGHAWDWAWQDESSSTWSFVELLSGQDLYAEGQVMRHCVASYAARCAVGYSAIVSLRYDNSRKVTIEINPQTKKIVQVRGFRNRPSQVQEQSIISRWMSSIVLRKFNQVEETEIGDQWTIPIELPL